MTTRKQEQSMMLFGIGIAAMTFLGLVGWVKQILFPPEPEACLARYSLSMVFPRVQGATPISARDIQSKIGFDELGLVENVKLEMPESPKEPVVLDVRLAKGSLDPRTTGGRAGGVSFNWTAGVPGGIEHGCLGYHVFLPEDFDFHMGGKLPGLVGGEAGGKSGFMSRIAWREAGHGEVIAHAPGTGEAGIGLDRGAWTFQRGRWMSIEQEVMLNTPGVADGVVRVWVDGILRINRNDVMFRSSERARITGVQADVFYDGKGKEAAAPQDTSVRVSAFDLRWR